MFPFFFFFLATLLGTASVLFLAFIHSLLFFLPSMGSEMAYIPFFSFYCDGWAGVVPAELGLHDPLFPALSFPFIQ